jgi:hypothetical protein
MTITQAWHTAIVTGLLSSSCGDLILDQRGDLCTRNVWEVTPEDSWGKELPWAQQTPGTKLAIIFSGGWRLTAAGANYILENSIFDRKDEKKLTAIADSGIANKQINDGIHAWTMALSRPAVEPRTEDFIPSVGLADLSVTALRWMRSRGELEARNGGTTSIDLDAVDAQLIAKGDVR